MVAQGIGFVCAFVAVLFFGSNFVPVKKFETGDGVFFQFILCTAIWCTGNIVNAVQGFPQFEPVAMLGGFLWATGNMMCVPVIKLIGLSMGLLIWGSTNMIMGWCSGQFGLFGLKSQADQIHTPALNYIGLVLALVSLTMYTLVKTNVGKEEPGSGNKAKEAERLLANVAKEDYAGVGAFSSPRLLGVDQFRPVPKVPSFGKDLDAQMNIADIDPELDHHHGRMSNAASLGMTQEEEAAEVSCVDKLSRSQKRWLGIVGAMVSGVFYGSNFDPPQYLMDNRDRPSLAHHVNTTQGMVAVKPSKDVLDYVFSHFTGIFLSSIFYMVAYSCLSKNRPRLYPQAIVPAFISGLMWSVAQVSWFVANSALSFAVAFPLVTSGPGFVAAMWGLFLFKEITGKRNYIVLAIAFVITVASGLCIAMSRSGGDSGSGGGGGGGGGNHSGNHSNASIAWA